MSHSKKKNDLFQTRYGKQILFYRVPLEFGLHQSSLSRSSVGIYLFFMKQAHYSSSLEISASNESIRFETGIKDITAVVDGIYALAQGGWIKDVVYGRLQPNKYIINVEPKISDTLIEKLDNIRRSRSRIAKKSKRKRNDDGRFVS